MALRVQTNKGISLGTFFYIYIEDASLQHLDRDNFYFYTSYMHI